MTVGRPCVRPLQRLPSSMFFPSAWKTSVIVPLIKDEKERTMSNVRPISLQSCLGKLFILVLALRLGEM
jgi:hypothetical protein